MNDTKETPLLNLKQKTLNGFKWSFLDNVGRLGGQFVIGIILARILTPVDFGLVGMLTIFIVIGRSLTNSGFGQALIQKKNADNSDFSTVFYFNIVASIFVYLIVFFGSPLIAKFYNEPELTLLTKVICLVFIIDAFGLVHTTYLEKKLDFKAPSIIGVISIFFSGGISIFLAFNDFGVWALVTNSLLRSFITTLLLWIVSGWRPQLIFKLQSFKGLFNYGSKILIAGILNSIFNNLYFLVIGRFFHAASLGYYTRAVQFSNLPVNTITTVVQKVTYPVFSILQDNSEKLIAGYTKVIRMLTAVALPLMAIMYITAKPLIAIVLGTKWLPAVPYLQLMSIYSWIYVLYTVNNLVITAKGRSDYYLQLQVLNKVIIAVSILTTYRFGITALIYGQMGATILTYIVGSVYLKKVLNISIGYQLKNILPFIIATIFMVMPSFPMAKFISNDFLYLLTNTAVAISIYILSLWLMKVEELYSVLTFINRNIKLFYSKIRN